jgi:DNA/RNA endonuclease YhcR with UshA esterase domain
MQTIMKTKKYILFALAVLGLATSCQDKDWDAPSTEKGMEAYGNKYLQETNVKTIAEVIALYSNEINNNTLKQVTQPMQIIGVVTGNDEGGNIYSSLYIQDNTAAIVISISQSGLYGAFTVGQTVLVELQGLYIGGYGKQAQIGTTYTNPNKEGATPQVGRMSRYIWKDHYKLLSPVPGLMVTPIEAKWNFNSLDIAKDAGKLVTLKGVTLAEADGKAVYAPGDGSVSLYGGCAHRVISGLSNIVLRTSTYADFANKIMETERVDITGVAARYNDTWQIMMRTEKDIVKSTTEPAPVATPSGSGTQADPYNVAAVTQLTKSLPADGTKDNIYTKGYIVSVSDIDTSGSFGNATYLISDRKDGATGSFQIYRGYGLNGEKFNTPGATIIKAGDEVVIKGKVVNYKGNTPQYAQGSTIVSIK